MMKKLMLAVATLCLTTGLAYAQVDVNKADAAALDSIKGVGPAMSKAILTERAKGQFKDWNDFQTRVKGIGDKKAVKLSDAGLQVNGQPMQAGAAKAAKPARTSTSAKPASAKPAPASAKM